MLPADESELAASNEQRTPAGRACQSPWVGEDTEIGGATRPHWRMMISGDGGIRWRETMNS